MVKMRRALISVADKTGLEELARKLHEHGVEILSTGGTAERLAKAGIPHTDVSAYTGHPEILDGRVKTLHPRIHGGILAIRDKESHGRELATHGIQTIDLVVVNLYPFAQTIAKEGVSIEEVIESIDIGGPTMIRSAAKNYKYVCVLTDPADYSSFIQELEREGGISLSSREKLAVKAFSHTAEYDSLIQAYLAERFTGDKRTTLSYSAGRALRYGENWHQQAMFFRETGFSGETSIADAEQLHGKEMSYNNILDASEALEAVKELLPDKAVAVIKHSNPCGYATGATLADAFEFAWQGDPVSAFGSVIACSQVVDGEVTEKLSGRFVEVLIAPDFTPDSLEILKKKKNLRILKVGSLVTGKTDFKLYRPVIGGLLVQDPDRVVMEKLECVTKAEFPAELIAVAKFAYKAVKQVKSNAISLAYEYAPGYYMQIGMGAGQPNRIDALEKLAIPRAMENAANLSKILPGNLTPESIISRTVVASDAFFPFDDAVRVASKHGLRYIIQPGGSIRDKEVIAACDELGVSMLFTGTRHFKH